MGLTPASGGGPVGKLAGNAIRLIRHGCKNRPVYHIVVQKFDLEQKEQPIEQLGIYDPMPNIFGEHLCSLNLDRINHWLKEGSGISGAARRIIGLSGFIPIHPYTHRTQWEQVRIDEDTLHNW